MRSATKDLEQTMHILPQSPVHVLAISPGHGHRAQAIWSGGARAPGLNCGTCAVPVAADKLRRLDIAGLAKLPSRPRALEAVSRAVLITALPARQPNLPRPQATELVVSSAHFAAFAVDPALRGANRLSVSAPDQFLPSA